MLPKNDPLQQQQEFATIDKEKHEQEKQASPITTNTSEPSVTNVNKNTADCSKQIRNGDVNEELVEEDTEEGETLLHPLQREVTLNNVQCMDETLAMTSSQNSDDEESSLIMAGFERPFSAPLAPLDNELMERLKREHDAKRKSKGAKKIEKKPSLLARANRMSGGDGAGDSLAMFVENERMNTHAGYVRPSVHRTGKAKEKATRDLIGSCECITAERRWSASAAADSASVTQTNERVLSINEDEEAKICKSNLTCLESIKWKQYKRKHACSKRTQ